MKYTITILTLLISSLIECGAQTMKVVYSEKMDLTEELKSVDNPVLKQMIIEKTGKPKHYELISSEGTSIYQKQNVDEREIDNAIIMQNDEKIIYKNHITKTYVKQIDFMSRTFLIEDTLQINDWIITNDTLKIGEYQCKKATLKEGNKNIIAWFTNEVPSNEGPGDYYGLPGLILKIKTETSIFEVQNISILKDKTTILKPTKGKKVTIKEFEKIREEKINELNGGNQKNKGVQIIKM